jgi:SAM-dependent methyltransferase
MSQIVEKPPAPSSWVESHGHLVRAGGKVLDLACGGGRHSRWFMSQGYRVLAVDRDISKLEDLRGDATIEILAYDLEADFWPFLTQKFDGIVVTNYLHRPLFPHLVTSLAVGGILIYETFAVGHQQFGKPNNPNFLLRKGELQRFFGKHLEVLAHEAVVDMARGPAVRQRICCRKNKKTG